MKKRKGFPSMGKGCLLTLCFFFFLPGFLVAQTGAPISVSVQALGNGNALSWADGGNNGATTLVGYQVSRSTTMGTRVQIATTTAFTFADTTAATGTQYFYAVREYANPATYSAWSEEVCRFWPIDGAVDDEQVHKLPTTVWCRWPIYPDEIVKTYVGLSTIPGQADVVDFVDVGHATEYSFTNLNLSAGITYYVTVKVQNTTGYLLGYGSSICSSDGFTVDITQTFPNPLDFASSAYFNNSLAGVMTTNNANSVTSVNLSNPGGGVWQYRIPLTLTERGIESRFNAPVEVTVTQASLPASLALSQAQIRVADEWGNEVPSTVTRWVNAPRSVTLSIIANLPLGGSRTYWMFHGNAAATVPAYGFIQNSSDTSQRAFSAYYSYKLLPAGTENATLPARRALNGGNTDDGYSTYAMPWGFPFFGKSIATWNFGTNSFVSVGAFSEYHNEFLCFTGLNNGSHYAMKHGGMISPMWCDTMINNAYPQNSGLYIIPTGAGNPDERVIFYSRDNRYNALDDIYIHQAVLYRYGDIALRYEYVSPGALNANHQAGSDIGLNRDPAPAGTDGGWPARVAGIASGDNLNYFWTNPINQGIGQEPTTFFQYKNGATFTVGTAEDAGGGWGLAAHFDSAPIDSLAAAPNWVSLTYDVTAGGGRFSFLTRTGTVPIPDPTWSPWAPLATATNVNVPGTSTISSPDNRYLQYRCLFQKSAIGNTPTLNSVGLTCQGIYVQIISANTPSGVSQGQLNIPVQMTVKNFNSAPVTLSSLALVPNLGTYTITLAAPALPYVLGAGNTVTASFTVSVATNSPVGLATIEGAASSSAPVFTDLDADTPLVWQVKTRALLQIDKVETIPTTVNKGQSGIPIRLYITNTGEVPATFTGASLTFSLGTYTISAPVPAPGSVQIPALSTLIATFTVNVLSANPSGVAVIDGTASGTNTFSGILTDIGSAVVQDSWTIQSQADLVLQQVIASSTVFRGQTGIPVYLTVTNFGEAKAKWDSSDLLSYFTLGFYSAVYPNSAYPKDIFGGLSVTASYGVDISPTTATGTSAVDAGISGTDQNAGLPLVYSGAIYPASWTILAEQISTFKDGSYLLPSASFNRPTSGNIPIFAKGVNLAPIKEFSVRWYDANGVQVASTNPPLTSDASGTLYHQYNLTSIASYGTWKVKITNPIDTITSCESFFTVVSGASISATMSFPLTVSVGQTFFASTTLINTGGAGVLSANVGNLATFGPGIATQTGSTAPSNQDVAGSSTFVFTTPFLALNPGSFTASTTVTAIDANSLANLKTATAATNVCRIQTAPVLTIASVSSAMKVVNLNQSGISVTLGIRNTGQAGAYVDIATLAFSLGSFTQDLASPPVMPFLLRGNSAATFTFVVGVDVLSPTGVSTMTGSFLAHDANDPTSLYGIRGATFSWTIATISGILADNLTYSPEQYDFNRGQTVYARYNGLSVNTAYRIRFYNAAPTGGGLVWTSPPLNSGAFGRCDDSYWIDAASTTTFARQWRTIIDNGTAAVVGTIFCTQFFDVQNPGTLTASLTLSPATIFVGDPFTANLTVTNLVGTTGSTIAPATPSALIPTGASIGFATLVSGPTPSVATITAGQITTFTWVYESASDTGLGSYSLTAQLPSSVTGIDVNTGVATGSKKSLVKQHHYL